MNTNCFARGLTRGLIGATAIVLLLGGAATAQTGAPPAAQQRPATQQAPTTQQSPAATAPRPLPPAADPMRREDVSKIIGATVYGSDDQKIGTVSTVLMQPESKQIDRFVVAEGGLLGIGAHLVALPVEDFTWDSAKGVFRVAVTEAEIKNMPEWKEQLTQLPRQ